MKQQEKMILIKEIYKGLGVNTSVESMEIKAFDIYAEQKIKELKDGSYFKHLQSEIEEAQMSVEQQKRQIKELEELLKVSICPNKRCVDGAIEVGDYIDHGIEQCQFCDNKEQVLKK